MFRSLLGQLMGWTQFLISGTLHINRDNGAPSCSTVATWKLICCKVMAYAEQLLGIGLHWWWCQMSGAVPRSAAGETRRYKLQQEASWWLRGHPILLQAASSMFEQELRSPECQLLHC